MQAKLAWAFRLMVLPQLAFDYRQFALARDCAVILAAAINLLRGVLVPIQVQWQLLFAHQLALLALV